MAMRATLWSWCEEMSYWDSPIISSKYAYSIEIRTSIYSTGVFSVIATWDQYLFLGNRARNRWERRGRKKKRRKRDEKSKKFCTHVMKKFIWSLEFKESDNTFEFVRHVSTAHLIEKIINRYITGTQNNHHPRDSLPTTSPTFYFKLPYIGHFSAITQKESCQSDCCALCSTDNFHVLDHASTSFQLKIKEAIYIQREQPSLNQQLHHVNLKPSF